MKKFAVIGLGKFGYKLATTLSKKGAEVIAIDVDKKLVDQIKDEVSVAVSLDAGDPQALESQGLDKIDTAVVCIGNNFEANQLTTLHLKRMGVPTVITKAANPLQGEILRMVGADDIIIPEEEMGRTLAEKLLIRNIESFMRLSTDHILAELHIPQRLVGKSIIELDLRKKFHVVVVYIRKQKKEEKEKGEKEPAEEEWEGVIPVPDYIFEDDDLLFVLGREKDVSNFAANH